MESEAAVPAAEENAQQLARALRDRDQKHGRRDAGYSRHRLVVTSGGDQALHCSR
jgi:hypothetical protein